MTQETETPSRPPRKTGSQRQLDYVARMRAKGYNQLLGLWVPNAIKDECRELVKNHVAQWESKQIPTSF
jgi:hypothetical protein